MEVWAWVNGLLLAKEIKLDRKDFEKQQKSLDLIQEAQE